MKKLALHSSCDQSKYRVEASHGYVGKYFHVNFKVTASSLYTDEKFEVGSFKNWGLWEYDVVEVFLRRGKSEGDYLELQASPFKQFFALRVIEPRKVTQEPEHLKSKINTKITSDGFEAEFQIELDDLPGEGDVIIGNLFACLGTPDKRKYFAINPNLETVPDFHRPDLFIKLGQK